MIPTRRYSAIFEPEARVVLEYGGNGNTHRIEVFIPVGEYTAKLAQGVTTQQMMEQSVGAPWQAIREWAEMDGRIRCSAHTEKGDRCMKTLTGVFYQNPAEWHKHNQRGGYCVTHDGL